MLHKLVNRLGRLNGVASLFFFLIAIAAVPCMAFIFHLTFLQTIWARLVLFWAAVAVASLFWMATYANRPEKQPKSRASALAASLAISLIASASLYLGLSYLPEITDYPFTLTWSEASRYYYASLYFSERIYGAHATPTVLHPSRYLLQAVPFLIPRDVLYPHSSILLHRAWQVLLWITLPTLVGYMLARRLQIPSGLQRWLFIGFVVLFLMIGPVYYHLLVPVALVVAGFHTAQALGSAATRSDTEHPVKIRRFLISALIVLAASAWAGISRVNWYPVPGCLAAALILLEEPIYTTDKLAKPSHKTVWVYILRLAGWVVFGTGIAFVSQMGYIAWSGNSAEHFTTSFTSDLLWHRLLPNSTYPPGLVLAIAIVSLPLIIVILNRLFVAHGQPTWRNIHFVRLLGLAGILFVFFTGGMVVSVKIGGGSNLHNLDAYMTFLLLISAYFYYRRVAIEAPHSHVDKKESAPATASGQNPPVKGGPGLLRKSLGWMLSANFGLGLGLFVTASSTVITRAPVFSFPDPHETAENLNELATPIFRVLQETPAVQNGGEILFIGNRQLITFGYFDLPLVAEYERVFLMEAAMANDETYLNQFHQDLAKRRFALIISEPLSTTLKKPKDDFGAENNAWVNNVSRVVLCYYTPIKTLRTVQMQILAPASQPKKDCP